MAARFQRADLPVFPALRHVENVPPQPSGLMGEEKGLKAAEANEAAGGGSLPLFATLGELAMTSRAKTCLLSLSGTT